MAQERPPVIIDLVPQEHEGRVVYESTPAARWSPSLGQKLWLALVRVAFLAAAAVVLLLVLGAALFLLPVLLLLGLLLRAGPRPPGAAPAPARSSDQ